MKEWSLEEEKWFAQGDQQLTKLRLKPSPSDSRAFSFNLHAWFLS